MDFKELKTDIFNLSQHVQSIERDIREMKGAKLEFRVADLEEKVFGKSRG
jgi:chaperonin cofactor prefoldin